MSVFIKGLTMPKGCTYCPFANDDASYCNAANEYIPMVWRSKFCPMIEIPTPHGRLIDADPLPHYTGYALSANEVAKAVEAAPTIIEAEEGAEE